MDSFDFDPGGALAVLRRHRVRFVVMGGLAARLHGSPSVTNDLDICYARDPDNLERLSTALSEMGARLRGVSEEVPLILDATTLRAGDTFTFSTTFGALDCFGTPAGTNGYDDLAGDAETMTLGGGEVLVASVGALIRMKKAAGRPKDLVEVEILGALRDTIEEESGE